MLCANAGRGLGHTFLDQDFCDLQHVVETNVTGTLHLLHRVGQAMREQRSGRIRITGSIAGFMPGTTWRACGDGSFGGQRRPLQAASGLMQPGLS